MADLVAPYVRVIENPDPVKDKGKAGIIRWCNRLRRARVLHMTMTGQAEKSVVPIVWARLVSTEQVLCIGIVPGDDQAVRFFLPVAQYLELQTAVVEG